MKIAHRRWRGGGLRRRRGRGGFRRRPRSSCSSAGPDASFANCGLPYYIGGEIADRDKLLVAPKQMLVDRHQLDVRTRQSVEAIDRAAEAAHDQESRRRHDLRGILRQADPLAGRDAVATADSGHRPARHLHAPRICATPIGSREVGLEREAGRRRRRRIHRPGNGRELGASRREDDGGRTGRSGAATVRPGDDHADRRALACQRRRVAAGRLGRGIRADRRQDWSVKLKSGRELAADFVVLSVGVRPENTLAVAAGLEVGPAWRHPRQRAHADQRSGHLCRRRRGRGQRLRDGRSDADSARRAGQPAGPDRGGPHLRPRRAGIAARRERPSSACST